MPTSPNLDADTLKDPTETTGAKQTGNDPAATAAASAAKDKPPKKATGRGGKRPGAGRPSSTAKTAVEDAKIQEVLAQLLFLPAVPLGVMGHPWPAEHMSNTAPEFAKTLTEQSRTNPGLRKVLLNFAEGGAVAILLTAGMQYSLPVILYFLTGPAHPARAMFGIPPRPDQVASIIQDDHVTTPPPASPNGNAPRAAGPATA